MARVFEIGQTFDSFDDFENELQKLKEENFVDLYRRDARTIEAARKRLPNKVLSENIKYSEMRYCCVHGGKDFKKRGKGERETKTYRQGCPFYIYVTASDDGSKLQVRGASYEHNHTVTREIFQHYASQRKRTEVEQHGLEALMSVKANKKLVQQKFQAATGKVITLKDLSNINRHIKDSVSSNDITDVVSFLEASGATTVEVIVDDEQNFQCLFVQDNQMKTVYNDYPEVILVDATYKLLDLRMPVYLMLAVDGNGMSEIIAVFLVASETAAVLGSAVEAFVRSNPNCGKTKVIMTDKDLVERDVFRNYFPQASLSICLFHTLRSFRREVTVDKMGITAAQRDVCLKMLQDIAYSRTNEQYVANVDRLKALGLQHVTDYFMNSWDSIKSEWVQGLRNVDLTFQVATNNRLESINGKIKSVCSRYVSMKQFFSEFFRVLASLRDERRHANIMLMVKHPAVQRPAELKSYESLLTAYAFGIVNKQYQLSCRLSQLDVDGDTYTFDTSAGVVSTTCSGCSCMQFVTIGLPCKHVLCVRKQQSQSLFDESLVVDRWKQAAYWEHCNLRSTHTDSHIAVSTTVPERRSSILSQHEKFRLAKKVTDSLASLCSEGGMVDFTEKLQFLQNVQKSWSHGENVAAVIVEQDRTVSDIESPGTEFPHSQILDVEPELPETQADSEQTEPQDLQVGDDRALPAVDSHDVSADLEQSVVIPQPLHTSDSPALSEPWTESEPPETQEPSVVTHLHDSSVSDDAVEQAHVAPQQDTNVVGSHATGDSLEGIIMPPVMRKRGRPKGNELTVVGLPRKKLRQTRPHAFHRLPMAVREKVMLGWFVGKDVVLSALDGHLITAADVEQRPNRISMSCLDSSVCLDTVRRYFTADAWMVVLEVVEAKRAQNMWPCPVCQYDASEESIGCDSCLMWYHMLCAGLKKNRKPKAKHWFCATCVAKA